MRVVPVVVPTIQWEKFVSETQASLGRSPTRSLDEADLVVGDIRSFLMAVGAFHRENTNPIPYLRSSESNLALDMISITYLVEAPRQDLYDILKFGHINIINGEHSDHRLEDVVLMSGTLRQWRALIVEAALAKQLSPVLMEIVKYLIRLGLRDLVASCDFSTARRVLPGT